MGKYTRFTNLEAEVLKGGIVGLQSPSPLRGTTAELDKIPGTFLSNLHNPMEIAMPVSMLKSIGAR